MNIRSFFLAGVLLTGSVSALPLLQPQAAIAASINNWRSVRVGMTPQQVINLIGRPKQIFPSVGGGEEWQYVVSGQFDVIRFKDGRVTKIGGGAG